MKEFCPEPRSPEARRVFVRQALSGALRVNPKAAVRLVELAAAFSDFGRVTFAYNWWGAPHGDRGHFLLCHLRKDKTMPQGVKLHCEPHGRFSSPAASMAWALANLGAVAPQLSAEDKQWLHAEIAALLAGSR